MDHFLTGFADELVKLAQDDPFAPKAVKQTATGTERIAPGGAGMVGGASSSYLKAVKPQRFEPGTKTERPRYRPTPKFKPQKGPADPEPVVTKKRHRPVKAKPIDRDRKPFEGGAGFMGRKTKQWGTEWETTPKGKAYKKSPPVVYMERGRDPDTGEQVDWAQRVPSKTQSGGEAADYPEPKNPYNRAARGLPPLP